jgi:predicted ATP-binding protein involved in virulence
LDNTWLQFKLDFAMAHQEFRLTNQTAHQSGFHSDNMMIEQGHGDTMQHTVDAIAQLATAMASDRGTVATLTVTNAKLASQLEAAQAYIKMINDVILALKAKLKPAWQAQRPAKSTNKNTYCWSHGHQVHKDHTSSTFKARKDGHQEMATKENTMGGVTWGKE